MALSISCGNPPSGTQGTSYTHTFSASGGTSPYTYLISNGHVPNGLQLASSTGVLSGTPLSPATFAFTIGVVDSASATASVACSIVVAQEAAPGAPCGPIAPLTNSADNSFSLQLFAFAVKLAPKTPVRGAAQ